MTEEEEPLTIEEFLFVSAMFYEHKDNNHLIVRALIWNLDPIHPDRKDLLMAETIKVFTEIKVQSEQEK